MYWLLRTPLISRNVAFADALKQHLLKLSPVESAAFRASLPSISHAWKHPLESQGLWPSPQPRLCPREMYDNSLRILFLASIAIAIQSNPDAPSITVGGLRFIVDVTISLVRRDSWVVANSRSMAVACGELLQKIDDELFGDLATLREFDCESESSDLVRKVRDKFRSGVQYLLGLDCKWDIWGPAWFLPACAPALCW